MTHHPFGMVVELMTLLRRAEVYRFAFVCIQVHILINRTPGDNTIPPLEASR